jgi:four helix bundle protein
VKFRVSGFVFLVSGAQWQHSDELKTSARETYAISGKGSFNQDYVLRDQIRRAVISIVSNIAEGYERDGRREFLQFLAVAKGSVGELRAQLYVAFDQQYIGATVFHQVEQHASSVGNMIAGLMRYLRGSSIKGQKYRQQHTRN